MTIGRETLPTTFFVIKGKGSYAALLGRDWIHANCYIPSTTHQCLIQWIGDSVEVVHTDSSFDVAAADPKVSHGVGMKCISGEAWQGGTPKLADFKLETVQKSARKVRPDYPEQDRR